jgi:hypothetical protein
MPNKAHGRHIETNPKQRDMDDRLDDTFPASDPITSPVTGIKTSSLKTEKHKVTSDSGVESDDKHDAEEDNARTPANNKAHVQGDQGR